jgi:flavin reductase (DIM6/NTAB) family NADH-FMN oxidoreductase RutF
MFYKIGDHGSKGLPFNPFKAIVAPRPIGWISTVDSQGRANLAPYSFFNGVSGRPEMLMFGSEGLKDTVRNARDTREFVFNLVSANLMDAMNQSAAALEPEVNEFEFAKIGHVASELVSPPRVATTPAALECKVVHWTELLDIDGAATDRYLVVGQVVGVYIDENYIVDGRFDLVKAQAMARCGYQDYTQVKELTQLLRPGETALKTSRA